MAFFEFELSLKHLIKYLLNYKRCPYCKLKLIRKNEKTFIEEGWSKIMGRNMYGKQYKSRLHLHCPSCDKEILFSEI